MPCERCCSHRKILPWFVVIHPSGADFWMNWRASGDRGSPVRADYDKVLRQRTALLKSATAARLQGDRGAMDTLDVGMGISPRTVRS